MEPVSTAARGAGAARLAPSIGLVVAGAGALVLFGWAFDVALLKSMWPGLATMKANTALGFILCGLGLWLSGVRQPTGSARRNARLAAVCATLMGVLGAATLAEHGFGWDLGLDQLLFRDALPQPVAGKPGRMAVMTAINFVLLAVALGLVDVRTRGGKRPSVWLALLVCADAYLAVLGYLYDVAPLYAVVAMTTVALPTAVLFVLAGLGVASARPDTLFSAHVLAHSFASQVNRRLLPVAILVPPVLGWLTLRGVAAGLYPARFGLAVFTTGTVAIVSALVWRSSRWLQGLHDQRVAVAQVIAWQQAILDSADLTVIATDVNGTIRSVNAEAERKLGYTAGELIGKCPLVIHAPGEVAERARALSKELGTEVPPTFEVFAAKARRGLADEHDWTYIRKDGSTFPVRLSVTPLLDADGELTGYLGVGADITQRKQAEADLLYLAHFDSLTGAANRSHLIETLAETIARSERDGHPLALVFLDLDRFKQINDTFGHYVGDQVLKEFTHRLIDSVRGTDTVARLAGDEFVVILDLLNRPEDVQTVAETIARSMCDPFVIQGREHRVSASMGIVIRRPGEIDPEALLRRADALLYPAKQSGRNAYLVED